jgi:ferredoxin-NADP reductase
MIKIMAMKQFLLTQKVNLTHDVFELHLECSELLNTQPGQFITLLLPEIGGRAYSILSQNERKTVLIIKRVKKEN